MDYCNNQKSVKKICIEFEIKMWQRSAILRSLPETERYLENQFGDNIGGNEMVFSSQMNDIGSPCEGDVVLGLVVVLPVVWAGLLCEGLDHVHLLFRY